MGNDSRPKQAQKIYSERSRTEDCIKSAQAHARLAHSAYRNLDILSNRVYLPDVDIYYIAFIWSDGLFGVRSVFSASIAGHPHMPDIIRKACSEMNDVMGRCMRDKTSTET